MKRYLLFCYDRYYPEGGMNDFVGSYETIEEARAACCRDYYNIADITKVVPDHIVDYGRCK